MSNRFLALLAIAVLATTTTGCATKKFVRNTIDPVSKQVGELDKRSAENARAIEQLDEKTQREISRVGEKAGSADSRAADASRQATEALTKTGQAIEKAEGARTLAENSMNRASQLERTVENMDNYRVASTKTVYFSFDKSTLTPEAQKELDELAQSLAANRRYVIEVQGFTDTTGSTEYNYALSGKRAASVVRYLTTQHKIPVYRIHTIGLGKDMPAQAEDRREARKLSRRVEVRIFTLAEVPQTAGTSLPPSSTTRTEPRETASQQQAHEAQRAQQPQERQPVRPQPPPRP